MELKPISHINEFLIGSENAFRQIEIKWQNTYRYLADKRIREIDENHKEIYPKKAIKYNIN